MISKGFIILLAFYGLFISWSGFTAVSLASKPTGTTHQAYAPDTLGQGAPSDTLQYNTASDSLQHDGVDPAAMPPDAGPAAEPALVLEPINALEVYNPPAYREMTNDSLGRWQLWSDQGEWMSRQPGVIAAQLGGLGRNDGFLIRGHESRHQRLYREGVPVNERIFGSANRKRLPHYSRLAHVQEFTSPIRYRSDVSTVRYHVEKPLTFINYEQTAFDYRSTEGYVTQNFRPGTNISIGYWGKNENEGYANNNMGGRNAEVTLYHYLTDSWILEGGYDYSGLQLGESHGYNMADMSVFAFDRFTAIPNEPRAQSSMRNALYRLTAYHRENSGEQATTRLSLYHDRYRRLHYDSSDSSSVRVLTSGFTGRHIRPLGPLELQLETRSEWSIITQDRFHTMDTGSWAHNTGKGMVLLPLDNGSNLHTWVRAGWRTDGFVDFELGSKVDWQLTRRFSLFASYARGEQMPQPGHLYWRRMPMYGNPDLQNEVIQRMELGAMYRAGSWSWGAELYGSLFDRPVLVGQDSTFTQAGSYTSAGATGYISFDGSRFEFALSGTFQQYFSDDNRLENQLLDLSGQRAWARASLYYKDYVYNRAAFIKGGFYLQLSPTSYRSSRYYPAMDYWDPNSWHPAVEGTESQAIPEFARLDLDLSARVRSVIFLFRYENALDNWLQPGYFETAYQPMPPSRFRFGIRWVLRN